MRSLIRDETDEVAEKTEEEIDRGGGGSRCRRRWEGGGDGRTGEIERMEEERRGRRV